MTQKGVGDRDRVENADRIGNRSVLSGLEELGVRQTGGGFLEGDEEQVGGGGLCVASALIASRPAEDGEILEHRCCLA